MTVTDPHHTLVNVYCREMLSFLQYVRQSTPYAGPNERPILSRLRELATSEVRELESLADYLGDKRFSVPHVGAFPSEFTNYNFMAVKKLLPMIADDQRRGLANLQRDAETLPAGQDRDWIEKLRATKQVHLSEVEKLGAA